MSEPMSEDERVALILQTWQETDAIGHDFRKAMAAVARAHRDAHGKEIIDTAMAKAKAAAEACGDA